ncbi:hypothetical protein [Tardiphaga sp.]|uniref:hypothetical protein n=1 Tax=Tardiphaga sp. TaxID=1926292 RepID=UPI002633926F|nr:hypothetical protein [Tardiphaga sp.]
MASRHPLMTEADLLNFQAIEHIPDGRRRRSAKERLHQKRVPTTKRTAGYAPKEFSLYIGRQRLGMVTQIAPRSFEAFDVHGDVIGIFRTRVQAIASIPKASEERL